MARVLLKARPTKPQLDDRLTQGPIEGLELYLDAIDISGPDWCENLVSLVRSYSVPSEFAWVVEGPLRSLDDNFFNIARNAQADREVIRRVCRIGQLLGAKAAVIHCIAPVRDPALVDGPARAEALSQAVEFLRYYATVCRDSGLVPTVENIPPIARMRESTTMHSSIGMEPTDLIYFADNVDGLRLTLDVSHAQLYINAARGDSDQPSDLQPLFSVLRARRVASNLDEFIDLVADRVFEVHVSNATGVWGEGLPYERGELNLDAIMARLLPLVHYIVTETIEPNADQATLMRQARERILAVRSRL